MCIYILYKEWFVKASLFLGSGFVNQLFLNNGLFWAVDIGYFAEPPRDVLHRRQVKFMQMSMGQTFERSISKQIT